jgi:hypothetical protein
MHARSPLNYEVQLDLRQQALHLLTEIILNDWATEGRPDYYSVSSTYLHMLDRLSSEIYVASENMKDVSLNEGLDLSSLGK